jgi:hypothetical protein
MLDADNWKTELSTGLGELMDQAVMAGARADQVFEAMQDELKAMKEAWRQDPDPADDPAPQALEEPANEWLGAER